MDEAPTEGDAASEGLPCAVTGRRDELWRGELVVRGCICGANMWSDPERGLRRDDAGTSMLAKGDAATCSERICEGDVVDGLLRPTWP